MKAEALKIVVLDYQFDRLNACESAVMSALKETRMKADVTKVSEPPFLARLNVWERLPALEINGKIWSRPSKDAFSKKEVIGLLEAHYLNFRTK